ncbi:MAG: hypothetical protein WDN27_05270 [Candidatus Saccharibacteria bacterium]
MDGRRDFASQSLKVVVLEDPARMTSPIGDFLFIQSQPVSVIDAHPGTSPEPFGD